MKSVSRISAFIVLMAFYSCSNITIETDDNFEAVELPDGSVAYLNHNSSIAYDEDFNPRNIEMHGEIVFSVTEGETPFIVDTGLGEVKVLGTEFNVKSDGEELEVEVEEGSVELITKEHNDKVGRGERASYNKTENRIKKGKAEFKFKIWMKTLKIEFKKMGKEINRSSKQVAKESKKVEKELKKEVKKLKLK